VSEVRDAIILAGGMGTRMLPASLFVPKEALPIVDTPIINHLIWEASKAGVSKIHLVLSPEKRRILEPFILSSNPFDQEIRMDLPRGSLELGTEDVEIIAHTQPIPGGVGDAISVVKGHVSGPFLVLLGDNVLIGDHIGPHRLGPAYASEASLELVKRFEETGLPVVGVSMVNDDDLINYGVVDFNGTKISKIVEKPTILDAPSQYVLSGRYLLLDGAFKILESHPECEFGELQSIALLDFYISEVGLETVKLDNYRLYDSGNPFSWLKAQVDHALLRDDVGTEFRDWIGERLTEW